MKIAVIGGGSWGTTLADLLAGNSIHASLWIREEELLAEIKEKGENSWYLPGVKLHPNLALSSDLAETASGADVFLFVVPCQFYRAVLRQMRPMFPKNPVIVCANKGIEVENLKTVSQVTGEELSDLAPSFAMLSGPSFAYEVSRRMPTAIVLGCADQELGKKLQAAFSNEYFRVYTNTDFRGVELGGAVKNVIAIAAGMSDGLGFGHNSRAALITRGLAEMSRLGQAMGARIDTFMGLAGMGDLVLTCTGDLSRNRQVGMKLGRGEKLDHIVGEMKMVAEGVKTTQALHALGRKLDVDLPITDTVHAILYQDKDPKIAVRELMTRELKSE